MNVLCYKLLFGACTLISYTDLIHRNLLQKVNENTLHVKEMTIKCLSGWLFSNFIIFIASFCRDE